MRYQIAILLAAVVLGSGCSSQPLLDQAEQLAQAGNFEAALQALQKEYEHHPSNSMYKGALIRITSLSLSVLNKEAEAALNAGNIHHAEQLFLRALRIDGEDRRAKSGLNILAQHKKQSTLLAQAIQELEQGQTQNAHELVRRVLAENPRHEGALTMRNRLRSLRNIDSRKPRLMPVLTQKISLELRDTPLKEALMLVSQSAGLNFVFDKDLPTDTLVTLFVSDARIEDVLEFILQTHAVEKKILNSRTLLIYPATAEKKSRYADLYTRSFHITHSAPDAIAELLRNVLKPTEMHIDEASRSLIMRDTAETLEAAERLIELHDVAPAEVLLDVEILEVSTDLLSNLGIEYPSKLTLSVQGQDNKPGVLRWDELKGLGSDSFSLGVGDPLAVLNIKNTLGSGNILAKPQIRVKNREQANILIGDKVPVITSTLNQTSGFESQSVSYLDVGIKLDVQPEIFPDNEVSMKVMLEVSNIAKEIVGDNGLRAYQIGTRTASTTLQLRDGETQILAGLIKNEEINSESRVPGLAAIPGLGRLFVNENNTHKKSELVLLITPRIVRNIRLSGASEFYSGTKDRFSLTRPQLGQSARYSQIAEPQAIAAKPQASSAEPPKEAKPPKLRPPSSLMTQLNLLAPHTIDSDKSFNTTIALDSNFNSPTVIQLLYDHNRLQLVTVLPALNEKTLKYESTEGAVTFKLQGEKQARDGDILATLSFKARHVDAPISTALELKPIEQDKQASTRLSGTQREIMIYPADESEAMNGVGDIAP